MKTNPVSFGSLMVYTINDGKPKLPIPQAMKISFLRNPALMNYKLSDTFETNDGVARDGTVHNAFKNHGQALDKKYKEKLKSDPNKVYLTETEFYINPKEKQKRYFLTAATNKDEEQIQNVLNNGTDYFVARFFK